MDQQTIRDIMSLRRRGVWPGLLRAAAWAASGPYGLAMRARRGLYRLGLLPALKLPAPVISVGNLTTGGTGKTPMVAWVVEHLKRSGRQPAILTRGYRGFGRQAAEQGFRLQASGFGRSKETAFPKPEARGPKPLLFPKPEARSPRPEASDEAEMLWQLTGVPVVVNPDRVEGGQAALDAGADVLVLDDGFQHLRLRRDLDLVLLDATNPFGYGHLLPRGMLREPPSALRRAGGLVITRCDLVAPAALAELRRRLARLCPRVPIYLSAYVASGLSDVHGRRLPPAGLAGKKVCAFCGLGNPESFFATVLGTGAELAAKVVFDDHVAYGPAELERVSGSARAAGAAALVTTAKDRVKIQRPAELPVPLWTLLVSAGIVEGEEMLREAIAAVLQQASGLG